MTDNQTPQADEQLPQVGWWCWRGDNHGHLATEPCRSDNVPIHVPVEWADEMREVIQRIEDGDGEEAPAAELPTEQTALRDRIRRVLAQMDGFDFDSLEPHDYQIQAAALLAVLPPPADRAAVLRELEERYRGYARDSAHPDFRAAYAAVANDLSRLADEAQQQPKTQPGCACPHPADEHSIYGCADGCGCEWMPKRKPDDYEATTGHLITCLAVAMGPEGADPDCPCAAVSAGVQTDEETNHG